MEAKKKQVITNMDMIKTIRMGANKRKQVIVTKTIIEEEGQIAETDHIITNLIVELDIETDLRVIGDQAEREVTIKVLEEGQKNLTKTTDIIDRIKISLVEDKHQEKTVDIEKTAKIME